MKRIAAIRVLALVALLLGSGSATAMQAYYDAFVLQYPAYTTANPSANCAICHLNPMGGGVINAYGKDWATQHNQPLSAMQAFINVENMNSDGDPGSTTNLVEITAGTQPGWTVGAVNTTYDESTLMVSAMNQSAPPMIGQLDPTFAPLFTNGPPPANGLAGTPYNFTYMASGTTPITFTLTAGALPNGLMLSSAGVISGTPTVAQAAPFTGTVTASNGTAPDAMQAFSITISVAPVAPLFTNGPPPNASLGTPYNFAYTASGTAPITFTVPPGALPPGLSLSPAGVISGTPTAGGTFSGTVTASNGTPPDATQAFSIVVGIQSPIPTLSDWALLMLALALGVIAFLLLRRRTR